jgi:hypothetical protein
MAATVVPYFKPTVGRIVHYFEFAGADPLPAIVVRVWGDDCINLRVFTDNDASPLHMTSVTRRNETDPGWGWDWPLRVE